MRKTFIVFGIYSVGAFLLILSIFTFSTSTPPNDPLNIVTHTVVPRNSNFCVNVVHIENGKICVKNPKEDAKISKPFVDGYGWDVDASMRVQEVMRRHPGAVFLDIGSNIGSYTLPVANMGRKVVAVDMMEDNLGYIKTSLIKSNLTQYVQLVHNAVSSKYERLQPTLEDRHSNNPGAVEAKHMDEIIGPGVKKVGDPVKSITINDLLLVTSSPSSTFIIRTDVEGFDCQVIDIENLLKNKIYIPYIFMKLTNDKNNSCQHLEQTMKQHGYVAFAIHQNILYNYENFGQSTCDKCDINILWLHKLENKPGDVTD